MVGDTETDRLFEALQRGDDSVLTSLLAAVHRFFCLGDYETSTDLLFRIASYTFRRSENERAIVLQSIALASMFAQRHDMPNATRILKIAAQYVGDWPERDEIVDLAFRVADMALADRDFQSAKSANTIIGVCCPLRIKPELRTKCIALASTINKAEADYKALR